MQSSGMSIMTERLELIPASPALLAAELAGNGAFEAAIGRSVPGNWPPELYGHDAINWILRMLRDVPEMADWTMYYITERGEQAGTVIGTVGYKGPPAADGSVEFGYGLLEQFRGRGYATEASRALIERAFRDPRVTCVIAETYPHLTASIGVMQRCGLSFLGDGSEPGVIRFQLLKEVPASSRRLAGSTAFPDSTPSRRSRDS
ncbi:MAG: GNAT family N-acetyltransferase [Gemmatimonadota bacterium]